jgi:hypothetical protein
MEEENQDIFSPGYFGCRKFFDLKIPYKTTVSPPDTRPLYEFNPEGVKCLVIFFFFRPRLVVHVQSHAHCKHAVLPNADRKK